jgi:glycosyltransferase involved in cell wall biosynthesis/SAM-dependent methyltransferase
MNGKIKISVLSSLYNCEKFLPGFFDALDKMEEKERMEILLLHNEPKEAELAVIRQFLPKMDFVRHIVIPERESLYRTWNRGIKMADGEYITIWNVDDVRFPDSIIRQAEALDNNPHAAIAYGDIRISGQYGMSGTEKTNVPVYNRHTYRKFLSGYYISCFQMWRKSIHEIIGYYDEQFKCVADFDFQIRAALHFPFVKTAEPLGIYLEYQPYKLSANGLQELENNIVYLRYGIYEKVNLFSAGLSRKKYRTNEFLFFDIRHPFTENKPFNILHRCLGWVCSFIKSTIKYLKNRMKPFLKRLYKTSVAYGFDPKKLRDRLRAKKNGTFVSDMQEFLRQQGLDNAFQWGKITPVLTEKNAEGGVMKGVYFHQDLYVARLIHEANPEKHLDIGSRTDGFIAHVASFREIELIDIRPIKSQVKNIFFRQADLMNLPEDLIDYCDSVSSLHAIEHFGLGRYGDPVDYYGHLKGINNITKILKKGGVFYFSVPMGNVQRIEFNEQRVFSLDYLIRILEADYTIKSFSYVNDDGNLIEDAALTDENVKSGFSCWYGCAIFTLIKK